MKIKKEVKIIIFIASLLIIGIIFSSFNYKRVDVIGRSPKFIVYRTFHRGIVELKKIPEGMKPSPPKGMDILQKKEYHHINYTNLYIEKFPQELRLNCFEQANFIVRLRNKGDEIISDIKFSIENNLNLIFDFPEKVVIPPKTVKDTTIFVTADCSTQYISQLNPRITIADRLDFEIPINVRERLE